MLPDIIDDFMSDDFTSDEDEEKNLNPIDPLCVLCDNGGDVISCKGKCLRSFHATAPADFETPCQSLGFTEKQSKEIETFKCRNCQFNQHQCYLCGNLGSSDNSVGAEVFQCGSKTCGHFYHPSCTSNALQSVYEKEPKEIEAEIASGKTFTCPRHFCYVCKEIEQDHETDMQMQFAVCRRCPRAYHSKCLPRYMMMAQAHNHTHCLLSGQLFLLLKWTMMVLYKELGKGCCQTTRFSSTAWNTRWMVNY